jgi:hypothetical protein
MQATIANAFIDALMPMPPEVIAFVLTVVSPPVALYISQSYYAPLRFRMCWRGGGLDYV